MGLRKKILKKFRKNKKPDEYDVHVFENPLTKIKNNKTETTNITDFQSIPTEIHSDPTDVHLHPTEPHSHPTEPHSHPTEPHLNPTETQSNPTDVQSIPIEPHSIPTEPQSIPTETQSNLTEPHLHPTEIQSHPTEIQSHPTEPHLHPTESQSNPTETQSEPQSILIEPQSIPTEPQSNPTEPQSNSTEPQSNPTEPHLNPTETQSNPTDVQSNPTDVQSNPTEIINKDIRKPNHAPIPMNIASIVQHLKNKINVRTDFLLQIMKVKTERQSGRLVNIFVNYRYSGKICRQLDQGRIPEDMHDYMLIRQTILSELNDFEKYPINVFWEYLAYKITKFIYRKFNMHAISMQLQIEPSFNVFPIEPGFHSAIVTIGAIEPLADIVPYTPNEGFL